MPPKPATLQDKNKAIMMRLFDAFNKGDQKVIEELIDPNVDDRSEHIGLDPAVRVAPGIANVKAQIMHDHQVLPDRKFEALAIIADGDMVALHWRLTGTNTGPVLGQPATGKKIDIKGTEYVRIKNGKVVFHDDAGYHALEALRQLDLLKPEILDTARFTPLAKLRKEMGVRPGKPAIDPNKPPRG